MKVFNVVKNYIRKIKLQRNIIRLKSSNDITIDKNLIAKLRLNVKGKNNTIVIQDIACNEDTQIDVNLTGDNNYINLTGLVINKELKMNIGARSVNFKPVNKHYFVIGKNTSIESMVYESYNSNTGCTIGENCMISFNVLIFNTDAHPIFDFKTKKLCNFVKGISIGDHCWIGKNVVILKNSIVAGDCVLGGYSVVSGKYTEEHAIYAGNPARLVKKDRTWNPNGKEYGYIDNMPIAGSADLF